MLVADGHIIGQYSLIWPNQSLERSHKDALGYLEQVRQTQAPPGLPLRSRVLEGDVAEAIVDTAAAEAVNLIVMSSHGYSGVTRWMLGSVAEKVLNSAACPVLVIRAPRPLRRILISLDGSPLSEQALRPGLEVAASLGAEVTLLRAVPVLPEDELEQLEQIERGLGERLKDELREEAEAYLKHLAEAHRSAGVDAQTVVTVGAPAPGILSYAEAHDVDLIVMATHGRTGLRRWRYGSVTEKVLRGGQHSMLVIRPAAQALR
jgi:nucleotide-binding universal stress UspA family protein